MTMPDFIDPTGENEIVAAHWQYFRLSRQAIRDARTKWAELQTLLDAFDRMPQNDRLTHFMAISTLHMEYQDQAAVGTIFAGLCAEAFINHFLFLQFDESEAEELEKMSMVAKWLILPKIAEHNGAKANFGVFQQLSYVAKARNSLVHFKTKIEPTMMQAERVKYVEQAEKCLDLIKKAILELAKVAPEFEDFEISYYVTHDQG